MFIYSLFFIVHTSGIHTNVQRIEYQSIRIHHLLKKQTRKIIYSQQTKNYFITHIMYRKNINAESGNFLEFMCNKTCDGIQLATKMSGCEFHTGINN